MNSLEPLRGIGIYVNRKYQARSLRICNALHCRAVRSDMPTGDCVDTHIVVPVQLS